MTVLLRLVKLKILRRKVLFKKIIWKVKNNCLPNYILSKNENNHKKTCGVFRVKKSPCTIHVRAIEEKK